MKWYVLPVGSFVRLWLKLVGSSGFMMGGKGRAECSRYGAAALSARYGPAL